MKDVLEQKGVWPFPCLLGAKFSCRTEFMASVAVALRFDLEPRDITGSCASRTISRNPPLLQTGDVAEPAVAVRLHREMDEVTEPAPALRFAPVRYGMWRAGVPAEAGVAPERRGMRPRSLSRGNALREARCPLRDLLKGALWCAQVKEERVTHSGPLPQGLVQTKNALAPQPF